MAVEGDITIEIKASTDKFDRQIAELEKRMKKEEKKGIKKEADITDLEKSINEYDTAQKEVERLTAKLEELREVRQSIMQQGDFTFVTPQGTVGFSNEYKDVEREIQKANTDLVKQTEIINSQGGSIDKNRAKLESMKQKHDEISQKVSEYKQKIENVKMQKQVADVEKLKSGFNNVGSSIQGAVKHVARLALGIFGIRSAYMALRRASSNLASYDQQYATNLEYIRYALTQMIAPVLQWIVRLAATLLGYINAIVQAWFGINLFSRGSAENFNKMKAGASGVSKAVKEIKKQLTGFDEINMLTDQSDTGTKAGGIGGIATPSFDLSAMQGEPPAWLQWIIDNKDLILSTLAGIAAGLLAIKLGASGIQALGIGVMVAGIIYTIQSLLDYLKDPSWENFGKVIQGIGIAIVGLGILIQSVPLIVAGAIILIIGIIIKYWEQIKAFLQKGIDWLTGKSDWVHQMFGDTIGNIYDTFVENLQLILNWFDMTFKNIKQILDGIIQFVKGVFTGDWKMAWEGVKKIFGAIWDWIKNTLKTVLQIAWNTVKGVAHTVGNVIAAAFKAVVNSVMWAIERVLNSPIRTINRLIGVINAVPGINLSTLPTFNLPRLKVGGIVNMPNKGTLVGGAITGESGREGVIPLTDQQAMAQLGAEIGRNVVVNLTNITKVGNRQIAREIKQINAEQEFAYNS